MDWVLGVLVLLSALSGFHRGLLAQVIGALGVLFGIWCGSVIVQWVGAHWAGAEPAVLYWALKWVVAVLSGLTVASIFLVAGEAAAKALRETPLGWLDRVAGVLAGAALTLVTASFVILALLSVPRLMAVYPSIESAWCTHPLLTMGEKLCSTAPWFPGAHGLRARFHSAARRAAEPSRTV